VKPTSGIAFAQEGIRQIDVRLRKIRLEPHSSLKLPNGPIDLLLRQQYPAKRIVPFGAAWRDSHNFLESRLRSCNVPLLQCGHPFGIHFIRLSRGPILSRGRILPQHDPGQQKTNPQTGKQNPTSRPRQIKSSESPAKIHNLLCIQNSSTRTTHDFPAPLLDPHPPAT